MPIRRRLLGDTPRPEYTNVVPVKDRRSREELMKVVNTYFTGIENNEGKRIPIAAGEVDFGAAASMGAI